MNYDELLATINECVDTGAQPAICQEFGDTWRKTMSDACEMPSKNATAAEVGEILATARTVAVVGLSDNPDRDSYRVAAYLLQQGFRILPINPNVSEVLGQRAYAGLRAVPEPVDIVNIFRKPEAVPGLVEDAIAIGAKAVWMQKGIAHNAAAEQARAAGLKVVMSKCIMVEHKNLHTSKS